VRRHRDYRGGYQIAGLTNRARELRSIQTPAETVLWQILRRRQVLGFKFRRQHQFGDYIADFYCHEARLVVECDGSVHNGNEQWQHDQERDVYMISQGLRVLRFSNDDVLNDLNTVVEKIQLFLRFTRERNGNANKKYIALVRPSNNT
jgi:very-short-patch-repair endonuclease